MRLFLSFWAIKARTMSTAVTGASATAAAGPALGAAETAATGAACVDAGDEAAMGLEVVAAGTVSCSTGSTS